MRRRAVKSVGEEESFHRGRAGVMGSEGTSLDMLAPRPAPNCGVGTLRLSRCTNPESPSTIAIIRSAPA
jgi:hypothetical protein